VWGWSWALEHLPPDVTAGIFWMKNRDPQHWRDSQQMEHALGKYIISDTPMTDRCRKLPENSRPDTETKRMGGTTCQTSDAKSTMKAE
jgi:hypothetical protein